MRGLIRNISGGGVFLEVPFEDTSVVKLRGEVNLEFTLELNDENMFVRPEGNIARLAQHGLGIEFTDLPEEIRDRVVDYVGEAFAEDTKFGYINLLVPTMRPNHNAFNMHKLEYLQFQQEQRKSDEAISRAIQYFKGWAMYEAMHSKEFTNARNGTNLEGMFKDLLGMRAFDRDEVLTAGSLGAGTLSYGFTGFTANQLFGKRVGPFSPGEAKAYRTFRFYQTLDSDGPLGLDGRVNGLGGAFTSAIKDLQKEHDSSPEIGAGDLLVDPWLAVSVAKAKQQQHQLPAQQGSRPPPQARWTKKPLFLAKAN